MDTFTPTQYLQIDIASSYGLSKKNWDERLFWFEAMQDAVLQVARSETPAEHQLVRNAKEPAMFYSGCLAWADHLDGLPIRHGVSLDATASGAQLLSIMIGCRKSAALCNVVDTGDRENLYDLIHDGMRKRLAEDAAAAAQAGASTIADQDLDPDDVKKAVMTALYGSTQQPERVFGGANQLATFYRTMEEDAPGIWNLNWSLLGTWNPNALSHDWTLPDNFHIKAKVTARRLAYPQFRNASLEVEYSVNAPVEYKRSMGANITHSIDGMIVREMGRRCSYDPAQIAKLRKVLAMRATYILDEDRVQDTLLRTLWGHYLESGFLSARVLELIDENNIHLVDRDAIQALLDTLPVKPFPLLMVHDCFRAHPNHGNDVRRTYNRILSELASSSLLQFVLDQLQEGCIVEKDDDIAADVLEANYALS